MKKIENLFSKSGKTISILIEESSSDPKLTIIDSPGGFIETKEKAARDNKSLIDICRKNDWNYISIDFSNNNARKDQPVNELRFSHRVRDLETVIDFVIEEYSSPIVLMGSSLGGIITLNSANYSEHIKAVVLNCAAVKAHICVKNGIPTQEFRNWKERDVAFVWGVPFSYDFYEDLAGLDATRVLSKIERPILWFHGTQDKVVPISQANESKLTNPYIELVEVKGGGHRFGDKMKKGEWENKVVSFLKSNVT